MKYLILIRSEDEQMSFGRGHLELTEEMIKAGVHVASEGLAGPSLARQVSVRGGAPIVSAGSAGEVDEHLAGFYLIDCSSWDEAVAWAAKVPDAADTAVDVRPVLDMNGWEF